MEKYALFLGCVIPNRYPGIEAATRKVMPELEIELHDMNGASCCPAPGVTRSFDPVTWLALAARNLSIAEEMGLDILTLCNGCYGSLSEARSMLEDPENRNKVNLLLKEIGREYKGNVKVLHIAHVLYEKRGEIPSLVKRKLNSKIAPHYGCHILRPRELRKFDDPERPRFLDELIEVLGATSVDYKDKIACCGSGGAVRSGDLDISLHMVKEKLQNIKRRGADCVVNVCPFCHLQFDRGQVEIEEKFGDKFELPVIYYTQLLGLALGFEPGELGLFLNEVSVRPLLEKIGL